MRASWFTTQIRGLFAGINYCIYSLVEFAMQGIFDIANLRLTEGLLGDIYSRIYAFLAIFMVFKLTVSFMKYLVNPETFVDKDKGAGKLITRTVTMLALVLLLPMLFPLLNEAQNVFLPVLPKVILGQDTDNSDTVQDNAQLMAATALGAFYSPCSSCDEADRPDPITDIEDMLDTYGDKTGGKYEYDFNYIFAMVAGIIVVVIVVSIAVKVGIRIFKMFLLELIAPIPVMSYIDPKASKDGAFAAWTKQLISTFLDIFVRLGVVYVVLMILSALADGNLLDASTIPSSGVRRSYMNVFLIIAMLMFAKDAPNFVKDALGIKHDKDTSGFLAAATGFVSGGATGMVSGAISGRGLRGAITGFATGASAGFQGGMTGKKAGAWRAAGDAAIQGRTGDSKAKSGILAAIQTSASKAQLHREARKLNLTNDTLSVAKDNMLKMQGIATLADDNFKAGITTGVFKDLEGNVLVDDANGTAYEKAQKIKDIAASNAAISKKNYEKADKAADSYKLGSSWAEDYKKDKKDAKIDYKRGVITKKQYKAKGQFNPDKSVKTKAEIDRMV